MVILSLPANMDKTMECYGACGPTEHMDSVSDTGLTLGQVTALQTNRMPEVLDCRFFLPVSKPSSARPFG